MNYTSIHMNMGVINVFMIDTITKEKDKLANYNLN